MSDGYNERPEGAEPRGNSNSHAGYPAPSDTYEPRDQGTAWPADAFTAMVMGPGVEGFEAPARHSYDGDGNMESFEIAGEYSVPNEADTDLGRFTGAIGPSGRSTPEGHPEVTAP